ncbi:MAG: transposase, partial [Acetivibrio sp.]
YYLKSIGRNLRTYYGAFTAVGLEKDRDAVENSVASSLSNGFVEGTNSKLKMIKRTMYGRCNKVRLEAKMMYGKVINYG